MTSDALQTLRNLHKQQAKIYQDFTTSQAKVRTTFHPNSDEHKKGLQATRDTARRALADLDQRMSSAEQTIAKRGSAVGQSVQVSAETRRRVERMLDKGWTYQQVASRLAQEGDRSGLRALREDLLIQINPQTKKAAQRRLEDAMSHLDERERPLYTDQERRLLDEMRETSINLPFMRSNHQQLLNHLDLHETSIHGGEKIDTLLRWSGLPEDSSVEKGLFSPGEEAAE